jgi:hypothetical protein
MTYRKLRITWSVSWGVIAVLLIVLWARSYWQVEHINWNSPKSCFGTSIYPGEVTLEYVNGGILMPMGWSRVVFPNDGDDSTEEGEDGEPKTIFGFAWHTDDYSVTVYIPFWFLTLTCFACTWYGIASPPIGKRFSLRILLIAMTLGCIGLGLVVWLTR